MLRIRFLNVGDGDAILIEEGDGESAFRMLVDSGRPRVPFALGSKRRTAAKHLRSAGIRHLDDVIITHLHMDHQGGLGDLARSIPVRRLLSGYIPQNPGLILPVEDYAVKTVRGMTECVNRWSKDVARLQAVRPKQDGDALVSPDLPDAFGGLEIPVSGTQTIQVERSVFGLALTDALEMDLIVPDEDASRMQRQTWEAMAKGVFVPEAQKYAASKARNPASLRVRLHYAGRTVELSGDCYGALWEADATPCDIFKVPHHADAKAITRGLVEKLKPSHAVISCAKKYNPAKDRPSAEVIALLRDVGAQVWFTDAFREAGRRCPMRRCLDFRILEDGGIVVPTDNARERMDKS